MRAFIGSVYRGTKLRPCPFCGNTSGFLIDKYGDDEKHFVLCRVCLGCISARTKVAAVRSWNTRAKGRAS